MAEGKSGPLPRLLLFTFDFGELLPRPCLQQAADQHPPVALYLRSVLRVCDEVDALKLAALQGIELIPARGIGPLHVLVVLRAQTRAHGRVALEAAILTQHALLAGLLAFQARAQAWPRSVYTTALEHGQQERRRWRVRPRTSKLQVGARTQAECRTGLGLSLLFRHVSNRAIPKGREPNAQR